MRLDHGIHLAYCTNIHRGETWAETFDALQQYTLAVRERVCPTKPYAIGLRLSDRASRELSEPAALLAFQRWLEQHGCYLFTINGFPYGRFHDARVKEQVYAPDWTTPERLAYTNRLFDLLAKLLPAGVEGSVSTVPGSFKEFIRTPDQLKEIRQNLWHCVEHIARQSAATGKKLHLGLEPEPLCLFETSQETCMFIERLRAEHQHDPRLTEHLGVNYDACHLAVEFEEPQEVVRRFQQHAIRISKLHFSSALRVRATREAREALKAFADDIYLHQVITRATGGHLTRYKDLDLALAPTSTLDPEPPEEWRIHFHVPLYSKPAALFDTTADHLLGVMDILERNPALCSHIEMETYTWEVLPPELKHRGVVDQLAAEYEWTLARWAERGIKLV